MYWLFVLCAYLCYLWASGLLMALLLVAGQIHQLRQQMSLPRAAHQRRRYPRLPERPGCKRNTQQLPQLIHLRRIQLQARRLELQQLLRSTGSHRPRW
jgi:hypothetical protein